MTSRAEREREARAARLPDAEYSERLADLVRQFHDASVGRPYGEALQMFAVMVANWATETGLPADGEGEFVGLFREHLVAALAFARADAAAMETQH